ncbi:hypothetical protein D9615_006501 [Tricholomella constricta]|uniref:Uncharacterized protein n=1 Tax=Tricholomella constricta TaxID=117010 RepID=A0A8H5M3N2_9AGAR|nr:hypothetical protein D9615_006501 [Tricholomella constricta]
MIHENRAVHNHRGLAARQKPPKDEEEEKPKISKGRIIPTRIIPLPTTTTSIVRRPVRPTTTTPLIPPLVTTKPVVPVVPTTTSVIRPTTTSASIVSTSATVPSPVKPTTTAARSPVTITTNAIASSQTSPKPSSSTAANSANGTGAVSSGAIAGGIIGGMLGAAALACLVFFLVRRYRRKSEDALAFNASKFRRSALLLDDPPAPPEKSQMQQQPRPRPPSMIERHIQGPAVPPASAAVPYGEHAPYSADPYGQYAASAAQYNVGMYGADGQVTRDPYADVYGSNLSGATYGQHAAYGAQSTQYHHQQQYPQQQAYHNSFSPGQVLPPNRTPAPAADGPLPNPFANTATTASAALAAARTAASAGSPVPSSRSYFSGSSVDSANTPAPQSPTAPTTAGSPYIRRQPTQSGGAPPAYEPDAQYADVQRDVKVAPSASVATNDARSNAGASTNVSNGTAVAGTKRPTSSYTVYDAEDAYGGM